MVTHTFNYFSGPPPPAQQHEGESSKKSSGSGGFLRSLLCCWRGGRGKGPPGATTNSVDGRASPPLLVMSDHSPRPLLPPVRHQDMHKKCMVIDLDETLVHSSFKVSLKFYTPTVLFAFCSKQYQCHLVGT